MKNERWKVEYQFMVFVDNEMTTEQIRDILELEGVTITQMAKHDMSMLKFQKGDICFHRSQRGPINDHHWRLMYEHFVRRVLEQEHEAQLAT